jgi:hypothetical protein
MCEATPATAALIGHCDTCGCAIVQHELGHLTVSGVWLCFAHAPLLSDVVSQYQDGYPGECFWPDEQEYLHEKELAEDDLITNGDRKVVWPADCSP